MGKKRTTRRVVKKRPAPAPRNGINMTVDLNQTLSIRLVNGRTIGTIVISDEGVKFIVPKSKRVPSNFVQWGILKALQEAEA